MKRILTLSLVEFLVDVVISVILVGLLQLFIPLDAYENILLGMLLVIALVIMRTGFTVFQIHEILSQIQKYQNKVEKFSTRLREILDGLRVVASKYSSDDNTLFLDWYEDKLASLSNHIRNTVENESFYFDASLIQEIDKILDFGHFGFVRQKTACGRRFEQILVAILVKYPPNRRESVLICG